MGFPFQTGASGFRQRQPPDQASCDPCLTINIKQEPSEQRSSQDDIKRSSQVVIRPFSSGLSYVVCIRRVGTTY